MTLHRLSLGYFALVTLCAANGIAGEAPASETLVAPVQLAQSQPASPPTPQPGAPAANPAPDANTAAPAQNASAEPIGNVAAITGVATVIRNKDSVALKLKDDIYLNDTVQTAASSSLGITFNDATTFNMKANARITIDNYVYEDGGKNNAGVFDIARGTVAFVAAAVAKTGDMSINTPTATLGIRGTTGLVEVPENAAAGSANNVNIKLYPDQDGRVGHIDINDRQGARLGSLTQAASGFAIRPGAGGARFAAVPLAISPQQAQRDQGFVRQVHATQGVGRQIVTEQRAFRRANPGLNRGNQPGRPGGQQPNNAPGQNRPGQPGQQQPGQQRQNGTPGQQKGQPGTPNRQGQQQQRPGSPQQGTTPAQGGTPQRTGQQPGTPAQPGNGARANQPTPSNGAAPPPLPRPNQNAQPGAPARPGVQPRPPAPPQNAQRPGLQNRPVLPRRPPPKGKKERR